MLLFYLIVINIFIATDVDFIVDQCYVDSLKKEKSFI